MKFPEQSIENLRGLGYTEDEARFLYLVATHSGYFTARQFLAFTSAKSGDRNMAFTQKVLGKSHATARVLLRNGRFYHLFSRIVYRAIGRENLRNRREHGLEHIRSRLMILDFVLAHLDYNYLETERDKIQYFCGKLSVPKQSLPTKRYSGAIHKQVTERYFVDKFPMFFFPASPVVNFTFVDPGWQSLRTLENHLFAYSGLFRVLQDVRLVYVATRPTHFEAARKIFVSTLDSAPKIDPGNEVLHYFRLRRTWELKKYDLFADKDIAQLNEYTQRFAKHSCQERYAAWLQGQISDDFVRSQFHDLAPQRNMSFDTEVVDGQAALFEGNPQKKASTKSATEVKAGTEKGFGSPFAGIQKEVTEE
ncbi:MAG TPA: hypothetical protein VFI60_08325 [Candidatus Acidoferrum sp.]|nr:hypothetical protein [Candidatus Acidoferrum sp.]